MNPVRRLFDFFTKKKVEPPKQVKFEMNAPEMKRERAIPKIRKSKRYHGYTGTWSPMKPIA